MEVPACNGMHSQIPLALLLVAVAFSGCAAPAEAPTVPDAPAAPEPFPAGAAIIHDETTRFNASNVPVGIAYATGFGSFEPTIGVTSDGALYMSNSDGAIATGHSSIIRSRDQAVTWEDITPKLGPSSTPPTSFDPYVHVDQDTDRIYNLDMEGLNCNYIQWSDDGGETFTGHPLGCGAPPVLDHPTLFTGAPRVLTTVGYENIVYMCVNRVADLACAISLDGGFVFTPFRTVFPELPPNEGGASGSCGGLSGHGTAGPDGRAYIGRIHCGLPVVAMTEDDGLTWRTTIISQEHNSIRHDVEVAVDAAGNVYALWIGPDNDLFMSVSMDHGAVWSDPIRINAPGVETAVFPSIAAGDEGRVALTYYGTNSTSGTNSMDDSDVWYAYLVTVLNATSTKPIIATATLSDHPIARGNCDDDNRCKGVGDFVDIVIDMDGRPWAGLIDACPGDDPDLCNGPVQGLVGTLRQGVPLRGDDHRLPALAAFA